MFLASRAFDERGRALKLHALARGEGPAELAEADLLDLLMAFPSVMPSLPGLLKSLDRLQPRLYSIASSPKAHPREVHLTVSAVRWDSNDRTRTGVGSCYLADFAKPGDVIPIFVQKSHGFGPPADDSAAAIMVGPGTGIAPFRAFLEEREARAGARGATGCSSATRSAPPTSSTRTRSWTGSAAACCTASTSPSRATRRRRSMSSTACRRPPPSSGDGWRRARTSMSAAMPSAWPRTSRTRCCRSPSSRAARARTRRKAWLDALAKAGRYQRDV